MWVSLMVKEWLSWESKKGAEIEIGIMEEEVCMGVAINVSDTKLSLGFNLKKKTGRMIMFYSVLQNVIYGSIYLWLQSAKL